jgi:hypothetical protein
MIKCLLGLNHLIIPPAVGANELLTLRSVTARSGTDGSSASPLHPIAGGTSHAWRILRAGAARCLSGFGGCHLVVLPTVFARVVITLVAARDQTGSE